MTLARNLYNVTKGSNSPFSIALRENGAVVSSASVTRCDLVFKRPGAATVNLSSSVHGAWFTLQKDATVDGRDTKVIRIDLKDTTLAVGRYEVDIYVFDAVNTAGRYAGTIDVEIDAANPAAA